MHKQDRDIKEVQSIIQHFDVNKCKQISGWLSNYIKTLELDEEMFKVGLDHLQLSTRAYHVLQNNKINSVGQLLKISLNWDSIKSLRGVGNVVLQEIEELVTRLQAEKMNA